MPERNARGQFTKSTVPQTTTPVQKAKRASVSPTAELGISTKHRMGRNLYDDFLPQLRGQRAAKTYREMADNDATIHGILFAIDNLLSELSWTAVPPAGEETNPAAIEQADFINECMADMSTPWGEHVTIALSMLPYGFSDFEIVYRPRNEASGSKFDDGRWGWRKLAYRPQDTIVEIPTEDNGGLLGIVQQTNRAGQVFIPIEKLLHYRTTAARGPEGSSILRGAYVPWFRKKRAEELLLVGIERDLAGLPVAWIPAEDILGETSLYTMWKNVVQRTKRDEQEGMVVPLEYDENGNKLFDFSLLSAGGSRGRLGDAQAAIRMWATDMAGSMLADWTGLGRDAVGSRALATPKIDIWLKSLETYADGIADTNTRHSIPRLLALNGVPRNLNPILTHSPVEDIDLEALGQFIQRTAQAGMPWYGTEGSEFERETAELAGFDAQFDVEDLGFEREPVQTMEADPVMPDTEEPPEGG